jgi:hypothetical protein
MAIHLLKTAAGLQEIDQLIARQAANRFKKGGKTLTWAYTRYVPKHAAEILEGGGSIYWILKNRIQVRQKILDFELVEDASDTWCKIIVDPQLYLTIAKPKRAIQGWRYLEEKDAPKDRGPYFAGLTDNEPPPEMADELKKLGLL